MKYLVLLVMTLFLFGCGEEEPKIVGTVAQEEKLGLFDKRIFACTTALNVRLVVFYNQDADVFSVIYGDITNPQFAIQQYGEAMETVYNFVPEEGLSDRQIIVYDEISRVRVGYMENDGKRTGYVTVDHRNEKLVETLCFPESIETEFNDNSLFTTISVVRGMTPF